MNERKAAIVTDSANRVALDARGRSEVFPTTWDPHNPAPQCIHVLDAGPPIVPTVAPIPRHRA